MRLSFCLSFSLSSFERVAEKSKRHNKSHRTKMGRTKKRRRRRLTAAQKKSKIAA